MDNLECVTYELLQDLLHFIYYGETQVSDLVSLLNAADELEIVGLKSDDILEAEKPLDDNSQSNVHKIFARARGLADKRIDINAERKKASKNAKVSRALRDIEDSDSEKAKMFLRRRKSIKPKVQSNIRKETTIRKQKLTIAKVQEQKIVPKKATKSRTEPKKSTRSTGVSRKNDQKHDSSKVSCELMLSQEEFELLCGDQIENDIHDEEELSEIELEESKHSDYSPECDEVQLESDQSEIESTPTTLKNGEDWNNNIEKASCSYDLDEPASHLIGANTSQRKCIEKYIPEYVREEVNDIEYDSDDGAVGGPLVLYGNYGAGEKSDRNELEQGNQNEWKMDKANHEFAAVQPPKIKAHPRRGKGKNAMPLHDEGLY